MSSSQQQSNNNQSQNPEVFPAAAIDEYAEFTSILPFNNTNIYAQQPFTQNDCYFNPNTQQYYTNLPYHQEFIPQTNEDDDIPLEVENQIYGDDDAPTNENDEDESVFSDAVQNAFTSYENEYAKYWKQNESDEETFEQMQECWQYMSEEVERAANPSTNYAESFLSSVLNPDAIEFRPSSSSSTDKGTTAITSSTLSETNKEKGQ